MSSFLSSQVTYFLIYLIFFLLLVKSKEFVLTWKKYFQIPLEPYKYGQNVSKNSKGADRDEKYAWKDKIPEEVKYLRYASLMCNLLL